jgi:hypothetical protein
VSVVLLALVGAGIGISVAVSGGGHKTRSAATSTEHPHTPQLPARAVSLPAIEPGGLGVLKILQPSQRTLTSAQALKAYRRIWKSPETVEACTMRSSHARETTKVRRGVS